MDQRVKVRIGNIKVIETKQGSLEMRMGQGEIKVGVLVWGCTGCNTFDQTTLFQFSRVQSLCLIAKFIPSFLCFCNRRAFFLHYCHTSFPEVSVHCLQSEPGRCTFF